MEAADEYGECVCVTCGKRDHYKQMQAGHFIAGRTNSILFREDNVHVQCIRCNNYLGGNQEAYAAYMLRTYGQAKIDELNRARHEAVTFTRHELLDMREEYRCRWKLQKERLGE